MAQIDTSELLFDPDFVDEVLLIRRTSTATSKGRNQLVQADPLTVYMSVQGPQAEDFKKFPELVEMHGTRVVWYSGVFNRAEDGSYSDLIVWPAVNGKTYHVHKIDEDYSNFGGGFNKAIIVAKG